MATGLSRAPQNTSPQDATSLNSSEGGDEPTSANGSLSAEMSKQLVQLFKLLSDETRLRIVFHLLERAELNVRTLCEMLQQSQPAVSHHLALLRVAGLIECRREGKHNFYRLLPERFEQLTRMLFQATPGNDSQIRFADLRVSMGGPEPAGESTD